MPPTREKTRDIKREKRGIPKWNTANCSGTEKIRKVLLHLAPPVMLAQLIQALYNIVDSLFVGRYSESGLTALSIIYPIQLLMIALAVGTGVGINTVMAAKLGVGEAKRRMSMPVWEHRSPPRCGFCSLRSAGRSCPPMRE